MKNLLIVGGGFAGVWAALSAAYEIDQNGGGVHVTLISKDDQLTLRPRLYQNNPGAMRTPLSPVLAPVGIAFVRGDVGGVDAGRQIVSVSAADGGKLSLPYDSLVFAVGSELRELPIPGVSKHTWNIDNFEAAAAFDHHLQALVRAQKNPTIVIVGSGLTGVELATEMRGRIRDYSDEQTAARARVVLIEQAESIGPELGGGPRDVIEQALAEAGVEIRAGAQIVRFDSGRVELNGGESISTDAAILTAGIRANPLAAVLGVELDELGRLPVDEMLRVKGVSNVYAAGDIAQAHVDESNIALMSCQHAMPMGKVAGHNAARALLGLPPRPYSQPNYVTCIDLGDSGAVFTSGWERQVQMVGSDAKELKRKINEQWIYPPQGNRAAILAASHIDAQRA